MTPRTYKFWLVTMGLLCGLALGFVGGVYVCNNTLQAHYQQQFERALLEQK